MANTISVQEAVLRKKTVFIDTRTPAEFEEDHLPKAINLPILSNDERAIVGTIYKQESKELALQKGVEFFSQRMPDYIAKVSKYKDKEIIVYCWRGGMRSRTVTSLLDSLGYTVKQLEGGYKAYREYVRTRLEQYVLKPKFMVLWGLTCTGKTKLLQQFSHSLDLEGLAQHRGSLYGAVGLKPVSQKRFENLLLQRLDELQQEKWMLVEGESKKIGNVQIPPFFYAAMMKGTHVLVKRSMEIRAQEAVKEYFSPAHLEEMKRITLSLFRILGKKRQQEVAELMDTGNYQEAACILLEEYYDPLYRHTLEKLKFSFEIENEKVEEGARELREKVKRLLFH
ncbi:tRNA 2-selenouridine(34) synthase MnmH [Candidatus Woesearchaeota archaeon]|nr:tRNA 2-selenouridine(34) synthase MnmH [Candidatus Woesearchaeota archaeon]